MRSKRVVLFVGLWSLAAVAAFPQGNPTGTLSGRVSSTDGLAVPGVSITIESESLQGKHTTTSSQNGDYIIPFLPPGDYTITFEMSGFQTVKEHHRLRLAETLPLSVTLKVAAVSDTVTVNGQSTDFSQTATMASSYKVDLMETLPTARTLLAAVNLSPGTHTTGPSNNVTISGALTFENLFLIDGVVAMDNVRNTPFNLFVEDAIQETTVMTGAISAEYGRFGGGVATSITKFGGNAFSGSFRTTFDNDKWRALTPVETLAGPDGTIPRDPRVSQLIPTYEATLGGPILKDRLWFFGTGRYNNLQQTNSTASVPGTGLAGGIPYLFEDKETRGEGKLTYSLNPNHTVKGTYIHISRDQKNNQFGTNLDLASLNPRSLPQNLVSFNYTGVLSPKFFVEAQYSLRQFSFVGDGAPTTDLILGTRLFDRSRNSIGYHSPTFCGVCKDEKRDNNSILAKASYFLPTSNLGSHNVVFGFDVFDDQRTSDNHQTGSDWSISGTSAIIRGTDIFPVFRPDTTTFLTYRPILITSQGTHFRTYSGFINDSWRFNNFVSLNVGLRYDKNDGKDSSGATVVKDSALSPRLSLTLDPKGDGLWTVNVGFGKYVDGIANSVADGGSGAGRPASYAFDYLGPAINANASAPTLVSQNDAIRMAFDWFNANGGVNRPYRSNPSIPGLTTRVNASLASPNVQEWSAGVTRRLGSRGTVRIDGVIRSYHDFYATRVDTSTGIVSNSFGQRFDLGVIENTNAIERSYKAINALIQYRPGDRVTLAGNYTLSHAYGNWDGETVGSGPVTSGVVNYPEYKDPVWNNPKGDLAIDQRHKVKLWGLYDVPVPASLGSLNMSVLFSFFSGQPYDAVGSVDTRPFVTNPGYVGVPTGFNYFFSSRDAFRLPNYTRTDFGLNYSHRLGVGKAQLFARATVQNVFNVLELADPNRINQTVNTRNQDTTLLAFNPFTTQPVQNVNWKLDPNFGQALNRQAYQTPRTYQFSLGFRF